MDDTSVAQINDEFFELFLKTLGKLHVIFLFI